VVVADVASVGDEADVETQTLADQMLMDRGDREQ
jgi:hypothetical protein